ncbi:MAG: copper homeostasis protein CutC [Bacteroidales bacterium]|nr:copper homeostasis protein CutC [Bacteroidales bacterium]
MERLLEACCTCADEVAAAKRNGAGRIELCEDIAVGGVTPSAENIQAAVLYGLPVNVLVRPREGDFVYVADDEGIQMLKDIWACHKMGANGVVIGALTAEGEIDLPLMSRLVAAAHSLGLQVTFHRAFDECADPFRALEQIIELGCERLLTSGQAASAWEGRETIAKLVEQAAGRIIVMPGAGVTPQNLDELQRVTKAVEFHGTKLCTKELYS